MWCRVLARLGPTTVITRADNRAAIEAHLPGTPECERLRFVYYQLPIATTRWKPDDRGKRAYYLLWQAGALPIARQLAREQHYDLFWHVTWSTVWLGTVLATVGQPFVYGPIGGGIGTPLRLAGELGPRGVVYEAGRELVRGMGRYVNPLARASWRRAALILVSNDDTRRWLPRRHHEKVRLATQAMVDEHAVGEVDGELTGAPASAVDDLRTALLVGRLLPLKGGSLALRAVARCPNWRLVICGRGPDEARLRLLSRRLGLEDRVEFRGWLPRSEVLRTMRQADALLFPSLHDESPATVLEANACGLPVVCLQRGGVPLLAGRQARIVEMAGGPRAISRRLAAELQGIEKEPPNPPADPSATLYPFSLEARVAAITPFLRPLVHAPAGG
jgi:glycosyltransferase involved in cell wall biosynthesis